MKIRNFNLENRNKSEIFKLEVSKTFIICLENWRILISKLFRISTFVFRILILFSLITIRPLSVLSADPPIYSSTNYRVEMLNFGTENVLTSIIDSIPPTISAGPTVADVSVGAVAKAKITWTTSKASSSVVVYGLTTSYGSHFGNTTESVTAHTVTISGLTAGTTYHYKVRSVDSVGNIGESADGTFSVGDTTAPTISSINISVLESTYAIINWTTNENASSIIEYGADTTYGTQIGQSEESVTSHTVKVTGLTPSTTFHYRPRSRDQSTNIGLGPDGAFTTTSTPAISEVEITDITLNSAVIRWTTNENATTELIYGTTSNYGSEYKDEAKTKNHTVRLTNLISGTNYRFRIRGTDASGLKLSSDEYQFSTVILPIISAVKIEEIKDHSVIVRWTTSGKTDELIEYEALASDLGEEVELLTKKTSGSVDLFTDHAHKLNDLDAATSYRFRIYGKDPFGNKATSDIFEFKTSLDKEPPVITNLKTDTAVDLGSRDSVQVLVSWSTNEPADGQVEYGLGAGGEYTQSSIKDEAFANAKVIVVPKLKPGYSYHLRAVATDKSGNTGYSDDFLILAPSQGISLLELIFGRLGEAFGWMGKL